MNFEDPSDAMAARLAQCKRQIRELVAINFKGVSTRDRRPKMAAHFLRSLCAK